MKINQIDHVAINVTDIRKSIDFYSHVLGLRQLQTVDNPEFAITYFALPGGAQLELFDYHDGNPTTSRHESKVGLRHIAFEVEDVSEHERLLRLAGVEITLPTCDLPNLGVRVLLFLDPNGVTLEFCEKL